MRPPVPAVRPEDEETILRRTERKLADAGTLKAAARVVTNVRLLFSMIKDPSFHLAWATKGLILGALLYFVMPLDMSPDFIPFVGYVDDAALIAFVIRRLSREIDRYRQHLAWS